MHLDESAYSRVFLSELVYLRAFVKMNRHPHTHTHTRSALLSCASKQQDR